MSFLSDGPKQAKAIPSSIEAKLRDLMSIRLPPILTDMNCSASAVVLAYNSMPLKKFVSRLG